MNIQINIDGRVFTVPAGKPVREVALKNGIYIPGLCHHPDLPPASQTQWNKSIYRGETFIDGEIVDETAGEKGNCDLCLIKVEGKSELQRACETETYVGIVIQTQNEEITLERRKALSKILATHPHSCLTCAQREGCSLTQCSANVPEAERCCPLLNRCELGKIVDFIGIPGETPKYLPANFPPLIADPFFDRDYNLCIGCLRCVRICNDVRGVTALGATWKNDQIWVGTVKPGLLSESYCRYCGACVEVCPTGALRDKPESKPIHSGESPPCVKACPAGIDIPAYVRLIGEGDFAGALNVIYDSIPFPGILGYICFHPCQDNCRRGILNESISICALKRFVYEHSLKEKVPGLTRENPTGKKVAIVGSGPAGLTAAFYLQKAGHQVEVYETADQHGGMLRYAIPDYRLPEYVLENEIKSLHSLGVKFITAKRLGRDFKLIDLLNGNYNAVLIAIGANASKNLSIPGNNLDGIKLALEFLVSVRKSQISRLKGRAVVIGGGNVAVDSAMTALRLGAEKVQMVCLEQSEEMPAHTWEIQQAEEEGIQIVHGWGPKEFIGENGRLRKIIFERCTRVFDDNGEFRPLYAENEIMEIEADSAIIAIGQSIETTALENLNLGTDGIIKTDEDSFATNIAGIFAAGDVIRGIGSVVEAIADGRKAADAIDKMLGGKGILKPEEKDYATENPFIGSDLQFHNRKPIFPNHQNPGNRIKNFKVIEQSYEPEKARNEALRCLLCHLRAKITPITLPPDKWQLLCKENITIIPAIEGVYQLADINKKVIKIVGTADIRSALKEELNKKYEDILFCWEEDKMYSKRESELLQRYLQEHGEMPKGGDSDLDDLF